eukprot:8823250-Pyramimonas_sp.AAC.1
MTVRCPTGHRQRPSGGLVCLARRSSWLLLGRRLARRAPMGLGWRNLVHQVRCTMSEGDLAPSSCWGPSR